MYGTFTLRCKMPALAYAKDHVKVADELFLIVALLHRENPHTKSFTIAEVMERATKEGLGTARSDQRSLRQHAYEHAAANVAPGKQGGRYRMVFREEDNRIRLLRNSDYVHPDRHQKVRPNLDEIPERYHELVRWAERWQSKSDGQKSSGSGWLAGLHELRGLGKNLWRGIDPDKYVRDLREGWE
jgi:hypothetical protein